MRNWKISGLWRIKKCLVKMSLNKQFLFLLKILLSVILLAYLFSIIPFKEIVDAVFSADLLLFAAAMLLGAPINYLSALETRYLTTAQGINLSVYEILKIHLITSFYGLFLPGILSGGAVKWYKFTKYGSKSSAAAVVVFNRFLEVLMIVLMGILCSFAAFYLSGNHKLFVVLVLVFVLMIILYFALVNKSALNLIEKFFLTLPLPKVIKRTTGRFFNAMHRYQNLHLQDHLEIIGLLLLYHGIGVVSFFFFAKSLGINLSIWDLGWIRSAMSLAIMLPLSFAGLGIREGTIVFLLAQYGIKPDVSMALSFLFFSRNILTAFLGGFLEFRNFALTKNNENRKAAKAADNNFF